MTKAQLIRNLKQIAGFYGCKASFILNVRDNTAGSWLGTKIVIKSNLANSDLISTFFHELGHFRNWKLNRYPKYHTPSNFLKINKVYPSYQKFLTYALEAEIFTDQVGKQLCKEWFPGFEYNRNYYRDLKSRTFLDYNYRYWEFKFKRKSR